MGRVLLSLLIPFTLVASSSAGDVRVKGHFRNGKWVSSHYRSIPDGNFSNNWSTYGNINPYTGKRGTLRQPSNSSSKSLRSYSGSRISMHSGGNRQRINSANDGSWEDFFRKQRQEQAKKQEGQQWGRDWQTQPSDMDRRIEKANELHQLGYFVDWQDYSWLEMWEFVRRIEIANEIQQLGQYVDWQQYSWFEMFQFKSDLELNQELATIRQSFAPANEKPRASSTVNLWTPYSQRPLIQTIMESLVFWYCWWLLEFPHLYFSCNGRKSRLKRKVMRHSPS